MINKLSLLLLLSIPVISELAFDQPEEEDVVVLTQESFQPFLEKYQKVFVKFYAPWCQHCKALAPIWSKLAKELKEQNIPIAKVDLTVHEELSKTYKIAGYPTLMLFINAQPIIYKNKREQEDLKKFLLNTNLPIIKKIATIDEVLKFSSQRISVLLIHPKDYDQFHSFRALSFNFPKLQFRTTDSDKIRERYEIQSKFAFVVFREFDDGKKFLVFDSSPSYHALEGFLEVVQFPIVMEFNKDTAQRIFAKRHPILFFFHDEAQSKGLNDLKEFAKNNKKVFYCHSTVTKDYGQKLAEHLGVTENDTLMYVEFDNQNMIKYKFGNTSEDSLKEYFKKLENKEIKQFIKSEEPVDNSQNNVKIVCSKNYQELVKNGEWVLLEFYAPWCPHCQKLAPIYEQIALKAKGIKELTIAKIDYTKNEIQGVNIRGFPTIKLFGPKLPEGINYDGDNELDPLIEFLEKETGIKIGELKTDEL